MLVLKRIGLLVLVLGFMVAIGLSVNAHFFHDNTVPYLEFEGKASISCNIDGKRFTHTRVVRDGKIIVDFWHEKPIDPEIKIEAEAHGFGWAHTTLHGNIDGKPFDSDGNADDSVHSPTSEKLGTWTDLLPFVYGVDHEIVVKHKGKFNKDPKEYKWDASGTIDLIPYYWKWGSALFVIPTGSWEVGEDKFHRKTDAKGNGGWTVDRNWSTEGSRSKEVPDPDDDDDDDSEEQGNVDPTVPDRPGSFELTPHKYAIRLQWTGSASDGGSPITDYQYQKQSSRSNRKHWSSWSDWISAGTGSTTWLNGLSKGVDYAVRMRAVNAIGSSTVTGIKIVKTKE